MPTKFPSTFPLRGSLFKFSKEASHFIIFFPPYHTINKVKQTDVIFTPFNTTRNLQNGESQFNFSRKRERRRFRTGRIGFDISGDRMLERPPKHNVPAPALRSALPSLLSRLVNSPQRKS